MGETWGGLRGEDRSAATILAERLGVQLAEALRLVPLLPMATTDAHGRPRTWGSAEAARSLPLAQLRQYLAAVRC